jgi:hypothetical protein
MSCGFLILASNLYRTLALFSEGDSMASEETHAGKSSGVAGAGGFLSWLGSTASEGIATIC